MAELHHGLDRVSHWAAASWPGGPSAPDAETGICHALRRIDGTFSPVFFCSARLLTSAATPKNTKTTKTTSPELPPLPAACSACSKRSRACRDQHPRQCTSLQTTTRYSSPSAMFINVGTSSRGRQRQFGGTAGDEEGLERRAILPSCSWNYDISSEQAGQLLCTVMKYAA